MRDKQASAPPWFFSPVCVCMSVCLPASVLLANIGRGVAWGVVGCVCMAVCVRVFVAAANLCPTTGTWGVSANMSPCTWPQVSVVTGVHHGCPSDTRV